MWLLEEIKCVKTNINVREWKFIFPSEISEIQNSKFPHLYSKCISSYKVNERILEYGSLS